MLKRCSSRPAAETLDRFLGNRGEEVDKIAVGVAKQCRAVPHGIVVGSCTHSSTSGFKREYSASTSGTRNSMMTVWLSAARAEPAPNSCTVWE
ncbi:hypothetical protein LJK88_49280 [Paenibacillus sp. P26]|nr:hypothetical protein LJK88_49280 [Paenibacillus sp. P26]